ncbi:MAG: tetratricopeptide repeat protein [Bradymonadaceae bacterium]
MSTKPTVPPIERIRSVFMRAAAWFWPTWTYRACFGFVCIVALVLCFIPLFNLLGYESAAFFGVVAGLMGTGLTLHAHRAGLFDGPVARERERAPTVDFLLVLGRHAPFVIAPMIILALNAVRVPTCDWTAGFSFWGLIPPVSLAIGQSLAWAALSISPERRYQQRLLAFGAAALSAAWLAWLLAMEPPIVGFQWWMGYFGGSIYDEAMAIEPALIWYRLLNLGMIVSIVLGVEVAWRHRRGTRPLRLGVLLIIVFLITSLGWLGRKDVGIDIDRAQIAQELGGRLETEHFIIHYPLREPFISQLDLLAEDHEYRYAQMTEFFRTDPNTNSGRKVRSFVYADRESKGRLMGARNTLIAKLWLHEMHILWRGYGDRLLAHELAHIFTEPFGAGPLRLSMQKGVGVNMGLVEGIATAADWPASELTPHEAGAALHAQDLAPDIRNLLGATGFWTQASGRAYTLMGSFVRYLIDTYGIENFKVAYGRGDFQRAYGKSSDALVGEWEDFLETIELTGRQQEVARYLYDRPSIFGKVCARTLAELQRQSTLAAASGDLVGARRIYERIIGFDPLNTGYHLSYARLLVRAGAMEDALEVVENELVRELEPVLQAELLALRGDLSWHLDQFSNAQIAYSGCLEVGVPVDMERALAVKKASLKQDDPSMRRLAYHYLLGQDGNAVKAFFAMEWLRQEPENFFANYLVGRQLWSAGQWEWALPFLEKAQHSMGVEILDAEASRMLGQCYFFLDRLDDARGQFEELGHQEITRYREEAREWLDRIQWKMSWNRGVFSGG